jgi:homospermidine synthase
MPPRMNLPGKLVILGFGSIAQGLLPILFRETNLKPSQILIISRSDKHASIAAEFNVEVHAAPLTEDNFKSLLDQHLNRGDFLLNLSVEVASLALIQYCHAHGVLYLDTCIEPWPGKYTDEKASLSERTNYHLREEVLAYRRSRPTGPTALITMGANPGLVSIFVKQALLNMAYDAQLHDIPVNNEDWADLAHRLNIRVIHIAERDTQATHQCKRPGEFVNTWSVNGFISEGMQPAELSWGTHEQHWPADAGTHGYGSGATIYLNRPGLATRVRSWTPLEGNYHGFLVTHGETISMADHLTLRRNGKIIYRPTIHYAYHPCDDAVLSIHEMAGDHFNVQSKSRILRDEIHKGVDELGVLLMGNARGVYWYGSRLEIDEAKRIAPYNNATSMQVIGGILGGMAWVLKNPNAGIVEPDDIDHRLVLDVAQPYLGEMVGVYEAWTPLKDRCALFKEPIDTKDPWQFFNFRVT